MYLTPDFLGSGNYMSDDKQLTDKEVAEVNKTIEILQSDINEIKNHVQSQRFNDALKSIIKGMGHTGCPLCKEKLAILSAEVIKAKVTCRTQNPKCNMIIKDVSKKADELKDEFIPIATEKKFLKDRQHRQQSEKGAIEQVLELPFTLPNSILDRLVPRKH